MLRFRSIAATVVAFHLGLIAASAVARLMVRATGRDPDTVAGPYFWGLDRGDLPDSAGVVYLFLPLLVLSAPAAAAAGYAAVQAALEPTRQLVTLCAVVATLWAIGWNLFGVGAGFEPLWFRFGLPVVVFASFTWAGRTALERRLAEDSNTTDATPGSFA